jgi:hypothetical protein
MPVIVEITNTKTNEVFVVSDREANSSVDALRDIKQALNNGIFDKGENLKRFKVLTIYYKKKQNGFN